jgi:hypothetical protein
MVPRGFVSSINHLMLKSSRIRVINAKARPIVRAFPCWALGSFPARIEMKIDIVDPENNFEKGQSDKTYPSIRVGNQVKPFYKRKLFNLTNAREHLAQGREIVFQNIEAPRLEIQARYSAARQDPKRIANVFWRSFRKKKLRLKA